MQQVDNKIEIGLPSIVRNTIKYRYEVTGPWTEAFNSHQAFEVAYDMDISDVPASVAVVPLLSNVLPVAWVYDAEVVVPTCDADFYRCLPEVERGYEGMYPILSFGGKLTVGEIEENHRSLEGAICLFSGGVDAFNTLIQHVGEKPVLLTIRGADIKLSDVRGWERVLRHVEAVSEDFNVCFHQVASNLKPFLDDSVLSRHVLASGDGWWHGFQHGLGLLGHAAPLAWKLHKSTVYIASSFTAADKGNYTCASDPTIDNYVRFCGAKVVHDGYEFTRQEKVRNVVRYSRATNTPIKLRVCWESEGGSNCCSCEKCLRTILAVYAEGADPRDFGFDFDDIGGLGRSFRRRFSLLGSDSRLLQRYVPIQEAMRENRDVSEVPEGLRWFYSGNLERLVHSSLLKRVATKFARKARHGLTRLVGR